MDIIVWYFGNICLFTRDTTDKHRIPDTAGEARFWSLYMDDSATPGNLIVMTTLQEVTMK